MKVLILQIEGRKRAKVNRVRVLLYVLVVGILELEGQYREVVDRDDAHQDCHEGAKEWLL